MTRRRRPPRPGALTELPPLKILSQIIILQTIYYVFGTALILFAALVAGRPRFSAELILGWRGLRGDTTVGWMLGVCWMVDSFIGVLALLLLISRSKLVPDFALSLHLIHLIIVSLYSHSIPSNALWWGLQFCSAAFMTFFGIWACQWRELRPIKFGGASSGAGDVSGGGGNADARGGSGNADARGGSGNADAGEGSEGVEDDQGFQRGRGRGRGRDGGGEYEMVGLNKEGEVV